MKNAPVIYVGNLDASVSEELLVALFGQLGHVLGCKIIHEPGNDPYAFIEFESQQSAGAALLAMNKRLCLGKEMKVNWATTSGHQGKVDTSKHYHIFVGDLAPEIEGQQLKEAFAPFGDISDVKIMRFPDTHKPKGYGFISFVNKSDAESAISSMNGQWLGTRKIRTNWATRKVQPGQENYKYKASNTNASTDPSRKLDYDDVWSWTSETNTSVYCGGIVDDSQEDVEEKLRKVFGDFGTINEVRVFKEKGYAFVKFTTKEAACSAICNIHGTEIDGAVAKCGWGRDDANSPNTGNNHGGVGGSGSMGGNVYSTVQYPAVHPISYGGYPGDYASQVPPMTDPNAAVQGGGYEEMPAGMYGAGGEAMPTAIPYDRQPADWNNWWGGPGHQVPTFNPAQSNPTGPAAPQQVPPMPVMPAGSYPDPMWIQQQAYDPPVGYPNFRVPAHHPYSPVGPQAYPLPAAGFHHEPAHMFRRHAPTRYPPPREQFYGSEPIEHDAEIQNSGWSSGHPMG